MTRNDPALLAGRILASVLFILAGFGKLTAAAPTQAYFAKIGVPEPFVAYIVAVELGGGILFLVGFQTRAVAGVLAVFCVATALLAHTNFAEREQQINFLKNLCLCGGLLAFVAAGAGRFSLDAVMRGPVAIDLNRRNV